MIEINNHGDLKLYNYYVIRDSKLFMVNRKDILADEICCYVGSTPSTPPDIELHREIKRSGGEFEDLHSVVNMDYFQPGEIKNYILDIGEFKDWWTK